MELADARYRDTQSRLITAAVLTGRIRQADRTGPMTEMAEGGMAATNRLAASGRPLLFADRQLSTHSRLSPAVRDGTAG